jgi:predicted peptidase
MILAPTITLLAMCFTTDASESISFEPGKQLPQSLTLRATDRSNSHDVKIPYLLFVPQQYATTSVPMPLLLFLHGLGECGDGSNLDLVKTHGPPKIVDHRPDFPFVLVSPQCVAPPDGLKGIDNAWKPEQLNRLIDHVAAHLRIDKRRIYVTGLSMGGYGTWRLAATYPEQIAAIVPICGGGEPDWMATPLARVPAWAYHGARDTVVPLSKSHAMVNAICQHGGRIRFTVYPEAEHNSWTETYNNEEVYRWLLSYRGPKQ